MERNQSESPKSASPVCALASASSVAVSILAPGRLARKFDLGLRGCQHAAVLLDYAVFDLHQRAAVLVDELVGHLAGLDGHVAGQRGAAVVAVRMAHHAPFARPARKIVGDPRAHAGAEAIAARHADEARPAREQVPARGADVSAVGQFGVVVFLYRVLLLARHRSDETEQFHVEIGTAVHAAPLREGIAAPFGGEADDRVRAERALGQFVAHVDRFPIAWRMAEVMHHLEVLVSARLDLEGLVVGPHRLFVAFGRSVLGRLAGRLVVADRGRPLLGHQVAVLVVIEVVAALEAGWAEG